MDSVLRVFSRSLKSIIGHQDLKPVTKCYIVDKTSMLVTDVGDKMCFCHQHPLLLTPLHYQQPKDVINIEILSLTSKNCHQDKVTIIVAAITVAQGRMAPSRLDDLAIIV